MNINKTVITFTVLHRADEPLPCGLAHVLEETDYGNAVGLETDRKTVEVPNMDVQSELIALGNDGEFFEDGE